MILKSISTQLFSVQNLIFLEILSSPLCVCVRILGSVGSRTQLCHWGVFNDYVLNYMFRPVVAIVRLPWEYLGAYCKLYRAHNVEISTCLVSKVWQGTNKTVVFDYPQFPKFTHTHTHNGDDTISRFLWPSIDFDLEIFSYVCQTQSVINMKQYGGNVEQLQFWGSIKPTGDFMWQHYCSCRNRIVNTAS